MIRSAEATGTGVAEGPGTTPSRRATARPAATTARRPSGRRREPPSIVFGPVRSRRLGWSIGIANVASKTCTYSCVYCQAGATDRPRLLREPYVAPGDLAAAVRHRLGECSAADQPVDYATFVPAGEPTLDSRLGVSIRGVAALGVRVAVLTNGSLLWRDDVRADLAAADLVSIKVDTVDEDTWRRLDRPIRDLSFGTVIDGMRRFAADYCGDLLTESMLVAGVNDHECSIRQTATFLSAIQPLRAYIAVPTRPPTEPWVEAPGVDALHRAAEIFRAFELPTSCLLDEVELDQGPFAVADDPTEGLLGLVAVHPVTDAVARDYLARSGADWSVAQELIDEGRVVVVPHRRRMYLRASR